MVLSHGFPIADVQIGDFSFSDHRSVVFKVNVSRHISVADSPKKWSRVGLATPNSAVAFSAAFSEAFHILPLENLPNTVEIDELLNLLCSG